MGFFGGCLWGSMIETCGSSITAAGEAPKACRRDATPIGGKRKNVQK